MSKQRTYAESLARRCRHFSGLMQKTCRAGVAYADIRDESAGPGNGYRFPCFSDDGACTSCPSASFLTPEEVAEREAKSRRSTQRICTVRAAIVAHTEGKRGVGGSIPCPCCEGGTVRFSVSGYNGHIHAQCSTKGCAAWME